MPIYTIYRAVNITNGKSYVGIDARWPHRKSSHISGAKSGKHIYFHRAIRKYGTESFQWEILFETENRDDAVEAEPLYIKIFGSFGNYGYNRNAGGGGMSGSNHTDVTKDKISKSKKLNPTRAWLGKHRDEETKRKIAEKNKNYIQRDEQKQKNSQAIKAKWQDLVWREKMLSARRKK